VPVSYVPRSSSEGKKVRHSDGWLAIWTLLRYRFTTRKRWAKSETSTETPFAVSLSRVPPEGL
jgi:hypothetical protein